MTIYIAKAISLTDNKEIPSHLSRELRRADAFIKYGALAAFEALSTIKTEDEDVFQNCGISLGSSYGPMETNFEVLDQVVNREQTSPTLFSHSVFNAASGYLARIFQLYGCAFTITDFAFPFFRALQQAIVSIESGQISNCIVLQIETFSMLLDDARNIFNKQETFQWPPGACAWLLTSSAKSDKPYQIDNFSLETCMTLPENYLTLQESLNNNGKLLSINHPLNAAMEISKTLNNNISKKCAFKLTAPYGEMILETSL